METELIIKRTDISTICDQVSVYMDSFNVENYDEAMQRWRKKHYDNPCGESIIIGAFDGSRLVGMNCFLRMRYKYNGESFEILQSCESGVLNAYQRRGIWKKIMSYATEYLSNNTDALAIIGFPNYRNSFPGFVKMGWKVLFFEKNMLMICNGKKAMELFLGKHWFCFLGGILFFQRIKSLLLSKTEYQIYEKDSLDICEQETKESVVLPEMNTSWLNWVKTFSNTRFYEIKIDDHPVGWFVTKEDSLRGHNYIEIAHVVVTPSEHLKDVLAVITKYLVGKGYPLIRVWDKDGGYFASVGYFEHKRQQNPFILWPLNRKGLMLENPAIWNPDLLDLDP